MSIAEQHESLQIGQDLDFQRKAWTVQRIGWAVMTLGVLAALAGLFGSGPLSKAEAQSQSPPLRVEYSRFARYDAPTTLEIHLGSGAAPKGQARVWIGRDYLDGVQIEQVTPQPDSAEAGADRVTYAFRVADPEQPASVVFHLKPQRPGPAHGQLGLPDGPAVTYDQLVYP